MNPTDKDSMTTLSEAQTALHQAQSDHGAAVAAASIAASHVASLREQVVSGHGEHISADVLAIASQRAEHAALVVTGAVAALTGLDAAVQEAKANEVADEVVGAVPVLGTRLLDALDAVGAALGRLPGCRPGVRQLRRQRDQTAQRGRLRLAAVPRPPTRAPRRRWNQPGAMQR